MRKVFNMRDKLKMLFLLMVTLFSCISCHNCNLIGCTGGFELYVTTEDGTSITEGEYTVTFNVEDDNFKVVCSTDPADNINYCAEFSNIPDNLSLLPIPEFADLSPEKNGSDMHMVGFLFKIVYFENSEYEEGESVRGPTSVSVKVEFEGNVIAQADYSPEYERDNDYFGDPKCGYCDSAVEETLTIQ